MKKRALMLLFSALMLTGCGQSEAQKDYARCNEEYASDMECTKDEFEDFLYTEYEVNADIFGGSDKAMPETQLKVINEINDKIDEIF